MCVETVGFVVMDVVVVKRVVEFITVVAAMMVVVHLLFQDVR